MAVVVCGLALGATASPAWAQKSGGGGGGCGGTTTPPVQTVTVRLTGTDYDIGLNPLAMPKGSATLSFDSTQTLRIMTVTVSSLNLPDGTQLHVELSSNAMYQPFPYNHVWAIQDAGSLTLVDDGASESISTADGLSVPLFGTIGQILITAYSADGVLLGPVLGYNYSIVASGGGGGGKTGSNP
jgi:hypothetical protein